MLRFWVSWHDWAPRYGGVPTSPIRATENSHVNEESRKVIGYVEEDLVGEAVLATGFS